MIVSQNNSFESVNLGYFSKKEAKPIQAYIKLITQLKNEQNSLFKLSRKGTFKGKKQQFLDKSIWIKLDNGVPKIFTHSHKEALLGKGGYKVVKKLTSIETGKKFALGQLTVNKDHQKFLYKKANEYPKSLDEGKYLLPTRFERVLKSTFENGTVTYKSCYASLTEAYQGDLKGLKNEIKSDRMLIAIICKMILSVKEMHKKGYCHRDIKPENWLYSIEQDENSGLSRLNLKLIDIDIAAPLLPKDSGIVQHPWIGTPGYLPKNIVGNNKLISADRDIQMCIDYYALYLSITKIIDSCKSNFIVDDEILMISNDFKSVLRSIKKDSSTEELRTLMNQQNHPAVILDSFRMIAKSLPEKPLNNSIESTAGAKV